MKIGSMNAGSANWEIKAAPETGFRGMLALCISQLQKSKKELAYWERQATALCPPGLRPLALSSLRSKAFHSIGGSIYACAPAVPRRLRDHVTGIIVALQTVSDYLDTLVDRSGCCEQGVHTNLHRSFVDCLDTRAMDSRDSVAGIIYFDGFPLGYDGGYLGSLMRRVHEGIGGLPGYPAVQDEVLRLARLYAGMQSRKHTDPITREETMARWHAAELHTADWHAADCLAPLRWWEFGAAAGSTLGIFALIALAADGAATRETGSGICAAYFPHVCAFHILLDYLIDRDEDAGTGDLNFTRYYSDDDETLESLSFFLEQGRHRLGILPGAEFHQGVLSGLPALYLSDRKVIQGGLGHIAGEIIRRAGGDSPRFYSVCKAFRRFCLF